jgi:hypothetical protein
MTDNELGGRLDRNIDAVFERLEIERRGPGVVPVYSKNTTLVLSVISVAMPSPIRGSQ